MISASELETDRMSNEEFYDAEIAPELLRLGKLCQDRGMSVSIAVEYEPGEIASTTSLAKDRSFGMSLIDFAVRAKGNSDTMIMGLMKHAREHGHSSLCLKQLGVPLTPDPKTDSPNVDTSATADGSTGSGGLILTIMTPKT